MPRRTQLPSETIEFEYEAREGLVSIVIVCYNSPDLLRDLLPTIDDQTYGPLEVICVLNGSNDETKTYLEDSDVTVVNPGENLWYSGGNDRGVEVARGEYLFVLNPDTQLEPESIEKLVEAAESSPDTAVFAPKVLTADNSRIDSVGMRATKGGRFVRVGAGEQADGRYDESREIVFFDGAAVLIRREAVEEVGLFDRRYETFDECHDLALRLYRAGWRAITVPESIVYHEGGSTYEGAEDRSRTILYYSTRNGFLTLAKQYNLLYALVILPLHVVAPLKTVVELITNGEYGKARARLRGLRDGLFEGVGLLGDGMTLREQWTVLTEYPRHLSEQDERG